MASYKDSKGPLLLILLVLVFALLNIGYTLFKPHFLRRAIDFDISFCMNSLTRLQWIQIILSIHRHTRLNLYCLHTKLSLHILPSYRKSVARSIKGIIVFIGHQAFIFYYPPEVSSMKYCRLGEFMYQYYTFLSNPSQ